MHRKLRTSMDRKGKIRIRDHMRLYLCEILLGWVVKLAPVHTPEGERLIRFARDYSAERLGMTNAH